MENEDVTVGRIVHFVSPDDLRHRAAVITHVWQAQHGIGLVNLNVFQDGSYPLQNLTPTSVSFSDGKEANTWHWID